MRPRRTTRRQPPTRARSPRRRTAAWHAVAIRIALVAACMGAPLPQHVRAQGMAPPPSGLLELLAEFDQMAARPLWPGFDPAHTPLAIYDGAHTWLVRHPSPPGGYVPVTGRPDIVVRDGRQAEVTANSSATIGGVSTATVMPAPSSVAPRERAGLVMHETFHVFQGARHPGWSANEADFFSYPHTNVAGLAARRREYALLRRALAARDPGSAACDAFVAITERLARFESLGATLATYERLSELNEGLATYVQMAAIDAPSARAVPDSAVAVDGARAQAYRNGPAWGRLLDRFFPAWRETLDRADTLTLDALLARALARTNTERPNCGLDAATRSRIDSTAAADVATLRATLASEGDQFLKADGWRLVIDAARHVLRPAGFDPLNVRLISPGRLLHARYLKLGNSLGEIEVIDRGVMTEAAGAHPLFNGVLVATITGLVSAPVVRDSSGTSIITADGVTARFRNATVERDAQSVRVVLAP